MNEAEKKERAWYFVVLLAIEVLLFLGLFGLLVKKGNAGTSIDLAFVDNSVYSKTINASPNQRWDKSVEYWKSNLEFWNEVWLTEKLSIDTRYKVDTSNGNYRGTINCDWNKAVNKYYTLEVGGGCYWKNAQVYPSFFARNTFLFDLTIFNVRLDNYLYLPIPSTIEMRNDIRIKLNIIVTYFSLNFRQEFIDNTFSTFNAGMMEVNF